MFGDLRPNMILVMDPRGDKINMTGEETTEPTFGLPAMWVDPGAREEALFRGYTVVDPGTVITTHLTEVVKDNMSDLLSFAETQKLIDELKKTNEKLVTEVIPNRTNVNGVWAIGDCVDGPWLAHKASHEGVTAAEAIAQELGNKDVHPHPLDRRNIPGCTYCHPQVASVGLTEAKAKEAGYEVKAGTFPFMGNGKAIALGEPEGFIKTVFDAKTGELLGAHMIGAEVTELIQGYVVGKTLETTEAELMQTVFPHPTLSEMLHEATLAAYGRALHI